jgi:hypothetical protein
MSWAIRKALKVRLCSSATLATAARSAEQRQAQYAWVNHQPRECQHAQKFAAARWKNAEALAKDLSSLVWPFYLLFSRPGCGKIPVAQHGRPNKGA